MYYSVVNFFSENQDVRGRPDSGTRDVPERQVRCCTGGSLWFLHAPSRLFGDDPRFCPNVFGHFLDNGWLMHPRPFAFFTANECAQLIDGVLEIVQVAVQGVQLGPDPVSRIFRALFVRDDEQIVLGDDVKSEAHLIEEQLQTGLESNSIELKLNGIFRLDGLPIERGQVEDNRPFERLLEVRADLV